MLAHKCIMCLQLFLFYSSQYTEIDMRSTGGLIHTKSYSAYIERTIVFVLVTPDALQGTLHSCESLFDCS